MPCSVAPAGNARVQDSTLSRIKILDKMILRVRINTKYLKLHEGSPATWRLTRAVRRTVYWRGSVRNAPNKIKEKRKAVAVYSRVPFLRQHTIDYVAYGRGKRFFSGVSCWTYYRFEHPMSAPEHRRPSWRSQVVVLGPSCGTFFNSQPALLVASKFFPLAPRDWRLLPNVKRNVTPL